MYFLIGVSLFFTFMLACGIVLASVTAGIWRLLAPFCTRLRPDT
jgi:hypothetical protein